MKPNVPGGQVGAPAATAEPGEETDEVVSLQVLPVERANAKLDHAMERTKMPRSPHREQRYGLPS